MRDAHLHVVDPATSGPDRTGHPDGPWWETIDASPAAVTERLRAADVAGGVLVQAVGAHGFDNTFVLETVAALGPQWRAVAAVGGDDPDPDQTIADAAARGAAGIRLFSVPLPEATWLDGERGHRAVAQSASLAMTPTVCCLPEEIRAAARLAAAYPDTEFAIDHAGFVSIGGDEGDLDKLIPLDNVVLKLSTGVFDHSALSPSQTVSRLVDLVGAERLAWGSDHPQVRDRDYATLATLARQAMSDLDSTSRSAILEGTAERLWFK